MGNFIAIAHVTRNHMARTLTSLVTFSEFRSIKYSKTLFTSTDLYNKKFDIVNLFVMYICYYMYTICIRKLYSKEITLGGNQLNFATSSKYFGRVIYNTLLDESVIKAKLRLVCQENNV